MTVAVRKKKRFKNLKWYGASFVLLSLLILHFYVPRIVTEIKNPFISIDSPSSSFKQLGSKGKMLNIVSNDGLNLKAYLTYS